MSLYTAERWRSSSRNSGSRPVADRCKSSRGLASLQKYSGDLRRGPTTPCGQLGVSSAKECRTRLSPRHGTQGSDMRALQEWIRNPSN